TIYAVSALKHEGIDELMSTIMSMLPEGPAYYPDDQLTDRTERFFISEFIRAHILELYRDEIPYTCEVVVDGFQEGTSNAGPIIRIAASIYTTDDRKKSILLGKNGSAIKQLGMKARGEIEAFLGKRVFLDLSVKTRDNWRDDDNALKSFGYQN
ncbi:MAG TPA: KH domain-containing protein, partial [Saprospiraceae bacterium]|nr:KH domain-containing protein [Saprospiraceae bacterium]